jgi:hypothetical protein
MKKVVFIALCLMLIGSATGCSLDKSAETLAVSYYQAVMNKDYNQAVTYFSSQFFEKTSKADLLSILQNINNKLGDLKSYKLENWGKNTRRGVGTVSSGTTYTLKYSAVYSNETDTETLTLFQPSGGELKILGFQFNSNLLLKQ